MSKLLPEKEFMAYNKNFYENLPPIKIIHLEIMTKEEKQKIYDKLEELKLEHGDLAEAIHHIPKTIHTQMQISRLKKRKLLLKDEITKLENLLMPDILA